MLINITGGMDMTLFEVDEAANRIRDEVDPDANIIFGSTMSGGDDRGGARVDNGGQAMPQLASQPLTASRTAVSPWRRMR